MVGVFLGLLLLFACLALDGVISTWLPVFFVFFLLAGCFCCCCSCAVCFLRMAPAPSGRDVPPIGAFPRSQSTPSSARSAEGTTSPSEDAPLLSGSVAATRHYRSHDDAV